jgi:hypothetical protein
MREGILAWSFSNERPSRSAAPGARFSTSTSARSSSFIKTAWSSGTFTSRARLSLDRFVQTKCEARPFTRVSYPRAKSPAPGRSILITRAPRSASWRVQNGAAIACSRLTTVMPSNGRACLGGVCRFVLVELKGVENTREGDAAGRDGSINLRIRHEAICE